jgi:hypothetical protein
MCEPEGSMARTCSYCPWLSISTFNNVVFGSVALISDFFRGAWDLEPEFNLNWRQRRSLLYDDPSSIGSRNERMHKFSCSRLNELHVRAVIGFVSCRSIFA